MSKDHGYDGLTALASGLATAIHEQLRTALAIRPRASLVLSGGSTPPPMLRVLRDLELPWSRVDVTLSDERWVESSNEHSNAGMLEREFFKGPAREARFVSLFSGAPDPASGVPEVDRALAALSWPADVVVLGMGTDGHTASLFPGMPGLAEALDPANPYLCCSALPAGQPTPRLSLTLRALLDARRVVLLFAGARKRAVFETATAGADALAMPVRAILNQDRTPVSVYWCPDPANGES